MLRLRFVTKTSIKQGQPLLFSHYCTNLTEDHGILQLHFAMKTVSKKPGKPSLFYRFSKFRAQIFMKDQSMSRLRFATKTLAIKPGKSSFLRRVF